MNKFKKCYHDTFNSIHAPDSIKQEVLTMAKKINQQDKNREKNNIITTQVEEVSKFSHTWRTIATSFAVIGICFVGVVFFNKFNNDIPNTNIEDTTKTSDVEITEISVLNNDYISTDNSNFSEIFGVNLDELQFNYLWGNVQGIVKYCTSNDDILEVLNSFDTIKWQPSTEVIPNNNEISTQLQLTLSTVSDELNMTFFYKVSTDNDTLYVRVINENKSIDKCYTLNRDIYESIYQAVEENNYVYFGVNPSNELKVTLDDNDEFTITNKDFLNSIQLQLFKKFSWEYSDEDMLDFAYPNIVFYQTYDGVTYTINLNEYQDALYGRIIITPDTNSDDSVYSSNVKLTSNNFKQDYNNLISLIKNVNSTVDNTTSQVVSEVTTTVTTTPMNVTTKQTTTPMTTTTKQTTTTTSITTTSKPITTTTPISTTTETEKVTTSIEDTQNIISLDIPNSRLFCNDLVYNMTDNNARPQFFDKDLQQYFAEAYSIEQWSAFGSQFKYDDTDYFLVEYEDYNKYYSRIINSEFKTVDDIRNYFKQYFTDDYINKNIPMDNFVEQDGKLYGINGARGGNMEYIGHSFVLDSQSSDRIEFHAEVYYLNSDDNIMLDLAQLYYQRPADNISYATEIRKYVLVKTDDGWRFDTLETML